MTAYYVVIKWDANLEQSYDSSNDLLYASTNKYKAEIEADTIRQRWEKLGEPKNIWVEEHEITDDVIFNYDWFNPLEEDEEDDN